MPSISTYISSVNPLFWQATLEQTIRHALLFSDEVVVADGGSTDGSLELLERLQAEDPRIKIYNYQDDYSAGQSELAKRKNFALSKCTGDYCVLQDDDECIHELYVDRIQNLTNEHPEALGFRFNVLHLYRNWNRYQVGEGWYRKKIYMIVASANIRHGAVGKGEGIDPDNFVYNEEENWVPLDDNQRVLDTNVQVFHYGWCRTDPVMLMKKYNQEAQWWGKDYWKTHEFPFRFDNPNKLPGFTGTHPKYMQELIKKEGDRRWIRQFDKDYGGFPWKDSTKK